MTTTSGGSARDRYLTIFGRQPVAEAVGDPAVPVARVLVADNATGDAVDRIVAAARRRGITLERVPESRVAHIARNGRHHQGVVADIAPPGLAALTDWLPQRRGRRHATAVLLLDGVHNPANVGMILRSATGAGLDGVVVPHRGTADLGPLVLKASAGVGLRATILRTPTSADAAQDLVAARFTLVGLDAGASGATSLFADELPERAAYVLGNEHDGISPEVSELVTSWRAIPLDPSVESLNVACAATLVAFEVARRRSGATSAPGAPQTP